MYNCFVFRFLLAALTSFSGIISGVMAQSPEILWTKTFGGNNGDEAYAVQQTSDGGYILTGSTASFNNGDNIDIVWLIRTNAAGDTLWTKTFGEGCGSLSYGYSVREVPGSGYIIAGYSECEYFGNGDDAWLIRTNTDGDTLWTRTLGERSPYEWFRSVQLTADGGYIFAGQTESYGAGASDVWLVKTDASGDTLWTKTYGGILNDEGASVQHTSDGGFIIAGYTRSFGAGGSDVWLIRTDASGDTLWTKTFGGSLDDQGHSVQQTSDGGYIIAGITESVSGGSSDVFLIRIDSLGNTLWEKNFGGSSDDWGNAVQQTFDGGFIVAGVTRSYGSGSNDAWLIRTNADGDTLWTKTIGGNLYDEGSSVQQTSDGGYVITGSTHSYGAGNSDVWLMRLDSDSPPQDIPDLPVPIGAGNAEVWNNNIYFFGGARQWNGSNRNRRVIKYDGQNWSNHDSIPDNNVWDMKSVLVGDDIYLLGGWPSGARLIRKYNLATGNWTYLSQGPNTSPWGTTAEHLNGHIYIFNQSGNVYEYNIASDSWSAKTPNITPGFDLSSVVYQNEIYIVGFYNSNFYKYNPTDDEWTRLADTPYPVAACGMNVLNNQIYCAGGSPQGNITGQYQTVLTYDIAADSWIIGNFQISSPRDWMADVVYQNDIYLLGGFDSTAAGVSIVEKLIPDVPVAIDDSPMPIAGEFFLAQNYPNPFNPETVIRYSLSVNRPVKLKVYDMLGREIRTLINGLQQAGTHTVSWDGRNDSGIPVSSGIYLYRLRAGEFVQSRKMILIR